MLASPVVRKPSERRRSVLGLLVLWLASACTTVPSRPPAPTDIPGNRLENPGFESGRTGWSYRDKSRHWQDFEIVSEPTRSGRGAVRLHLKRVPDDPPKSVLVAGVVQSLGPTGIPEKVTGWYRVDRWEKASERTALYLQFVAILKGDPRTAQLVYPLDPSRGKTLNNYQLRYYLVGLEQAPFDVENARSQFIVKGSPVLDEWVRFEIPLRADFERLWGQPQQYHQLDLLFEARWDHKPEGSAVHADVYYDDLYLGPAPTPAPVVRSGSSDGAPRVDPVRIRRPGEE